MHVAYLWAYAPTQPLFRYEGRAPPAWRRQASKDVLNVDRLGESGFYGSAYSKAQ